MTIAYPYFNDPTLDNRNPEFVWVALAGDHGDNDHIIILPWREMTVAEKKEWETIGTLSPDERWNWANEVRGMMSIRAGA